MTRTNVLRLLESAGIPFEARAYPVDENDLSGVHTARLLGLPPERLFKTLVLRGERTGIFVCCIPCAEEIDLRKAATAAGEICSLKMRSIRHRVMLNRDGRDRKCGSGCD